MRKILWVVVLAAGFAGLHLPLTADEDREGKGRATRHAEHALNVKIEGGEARGKLSEPSYGYVGPLGSFEVAVKGTTGKAPVGQIVVHHYPDTEKVSLGCTRLKYAGARRLGRVDGWVFQTEWDGKMYPSKIFFSAEKVYFGGGVRAYIAADYREDTGWTWKYLPLRRMDLLGRGEGSTSAE